MVCTGFPQTNNSRIEKVRSTNEFFEDQLKFKDNQKNKIDELRQKRLEITNKELKEKPSISKVS